MCAVCPLRSAGISASFLMEDTCTKHTTSSRKAFMHYGCLRQWIWARWQKDWNLYRKHRSFKRIHQHWTFWAELLALCVVFVWSLSFWSTSNPLRGRPCCIAKLFFFFLEKARNTAVFQVFTPKDGVGSRSPEYTKVRIPTQQTEQDQRKVWTKP